MQYSKFNHICKLPNSDEYLLFNFMTGSMLKLNQETNNKMKDIKLLNKDEITMLKENGFLIEDFDEIDYLKFGNKLNCADEELLSILIAPTMECNFNCPYCFEHHGKGFMTEEIQNEIITFIENSLKTHNHKNLFVYWFGGEPLLAIDIIAKMSQKIIELTKKYDIKYSSAMSTNGYLLTEKNINILEKCKLNRIQVTLDGMKEKNDKTRILKNGEGSFDVIVDNLKKLKTNITIHIRTNLNRENEVEFKELNNLVNEIKKENNIDISLYGAHMSVYDFNNENVDALELSIKEYSDILKQNNMIGANKHQNCRFAFCDAARVYSFCFDEKGNMYKCWNDIGNLKFKYDNVVHANKNGTNLLNKNALDFLSKSFPEECVNCKVLPVCMGGCIKKRVIENRKSCSPIKYNLDDYVYKRYLMQLGGDFNDIGN